jgi:predicted nucleotidyltransferase
MKPNQDEAKAMPYHELTIPLPARLWRHLQELARKYRKDGVVLFIFGSFAQGNARPTSDLDLGVEWQGQPNPTVFRRLYQDAQTLPTIRPIDLVDFSQAGSRFRQTAGTHKIYLP